MEEKKKKKSWKKKTAVGMVAAAASASVLVGGAFDSPADLMNPDNGDNSSPTPVVQTLTAQVPETTAGSDDDANGEEERQRFPAVRRWVQSLPVGVRALVGVPLWCVGWGITEALSLLWQAVLTPVGGKILSWLLAAAVCVLVYALTAKALFPHAPWKKILRPRNLLIVIGGMIVLGIADTLLGVFWKDYPPISRILRLVGGALMVAATCLSARKLLRRREKEEKPVPEVIPSLRTDVEQQAMALADSVCPPSAPRP
ncbi:MAG: hypothetical protein II458_01445 [Oscillospiraceae bacterium]|nr:hypothetical protein [Oscillospiraceae bacterium]